MQKVQKTYTRELKRVTVRLVQTSGKLIAQIARELGISDSSIHQWRKELAEHGPEAFPGNGHQTAFRAALAQAGITVSMSRRGNCYKNAVTASFFGTLKGECVGCACFQTRREAGQADHL